MVTSNKTVLQKKNLELSSKNQEIYTQEDIHMKLNPHKIAFTKKKILFTSKQDSNLRKKLTKFYTLRIAFYGAENWTLRAAD